MLGSCLSGVPGLRVRCTPPCTPGYGSYPPFDDSRAIYDSRKFACALARALLERACAVRIFNHHACGYAVAWVGRGPGKPPEQSGEDDDRDQQQVQVSAGPAILGRFSNENSSNVSSSIRDSPHFPVTRDNTARLRPRADSEQLHSGIQGKRLQQGLESPKPETVEKPRWSVSRLAPRVGHHL